MSRRTRELGPLSLPLATLVLWTGISILWSDDVRAGSFELLAMQNRVKRRECREPCESRAISGRMQLAINLHQDGNRHDRQYQK